MLTVNKEVEFNISLKPYDYTDCETHRSYHGYWWDIQVISDGEFHCMLSYFDWGGKSRIMSVDGIVRQLTGYSRDEFIAELMQVIPKVRG